MRNLLNSTRAASAALFITLLFIPFDNTYAQQGFSPYFVIDSFTLSETVPIKSALNDWEGNTFTRGKRQWTHNWLEAGIRYNHFSIGELRRVDYDLRFSKDLAEIYWRTSNKKEFEADQPYYARLQVNSFKAKGIRFAFHHEFEQLKYSIGISWLKANEFYDGKIVGDIFSTSETEYNFDLALDYHYTEDRLFDRVVDEPDGEGFSFDITLNYSWQQHNFHLRVKDLYGKIIWYDAPFTTGQAGSDRNDTDEDGFVIVNPTLSGFEGITNKYEQKLEPLSTIEYRFALNDEWQLGLMNKTQYGHSIQGANVSYGQNVKFNLGYWLDSEIIQAGFSYHRFHVSLGLDSLKEEDMEKLWLSISWQ
ncbi:MAG: hypothetical protein MI867_11255 [Pseudomonadales bacterium]|nr:hypothetical protein [Pseudomonadales bacterium]